MDAFPDLTGKTILQVVPELSAGGVERTVLEMTEAIKEAGGRALLASRGGRLEDAFEALGGELFRMDAKSKNPITLRLNAGKLKSLIATENVSLVHARSRAPAWSAYWAAQAAGVPFVTTYHGAYSGTSGMKLKYNSVMAKGDLVIANSKWIAAHIEAVHGLSAEKIVTIPRGVDLAAFEASAVDAARIAAIRTDWGLTGDKRLTLLLPGRLTEWKGQLVAIEALGRLLAEERDGVVLVLAGDDQGRTGYVTKLENAIVEHDLDVNVVMVDHIADMPAAYLAADIILAPSTRPEAFGRVAAEASAMGRAVIVTDHGGGRETVIEAVTGTRVEPGNAGDLAAALRTMISVGPDARAGMGRDGRAHIAENFSKRGLQAATLNVYKRVLEM